MITIKIIFLQLSTRSESPIQTTVLNSSGLNVKRDVSASLFSMASLMRPTAPKTSNLHHGEGGDRGASTTTPKSPPSSMHLNSLTPGGLFANLHNNSV